MDMEKVPFIIYIKSIFAPLFDFLFPSRCPVCGAYVKNRGDWCAACLAAALRVRRLPLDAGHRRVFSEAWSFGAYHGALRDLLLPLKFRSRRDGLPALRSFLAAVGERLPRADWMPGVAVPVPLFAEKEKERGGNQTELIFREWLESQGWEWRRAIVRTRATAPQFGLDREQRAKNVKNAFALSDEMDKNELAGKNILLVDDIFTTGATLAECAKSLKKAGVNDITVWTLASDRQ